MEISNPYQPPSLPADQGPTANSMRATSLAGIVAVAIGAMAGGSFSLISAGWLISHFMPLANNQQIFGSLLASLPTGCVFGGLFGKWCLLQFVRNR